jgi:hypothetical protein
MKASEERNAGDSILCLMASDRISIEVYGVAEAIKELRNLEPETYKRLTSDLRTSAVPVARAVGSEFPDEPLLNWGGTGERGKNRFPSYNAAQSKAQVKPAVSTRKPRAASTYGILRLQQMSPAGQIYDSAGSVTRASKETVGGKFIMNLDKHLRTKSKQGRSRSRVMYPATEKHLPMLLPAIQESVDRTGKIIERNINQ